MMKQQLRPACLVWLLVTGSSELIWGFAPSRPHVTCGGCRSSLSALRVSKNAWSIDDDWSSLSSESPENGVPDTNEIFNADLASVAASRMQSSKSTDNRITSKDDEFISDALDTIHNHGLMSLSPSSDPHLYDTGFESEGQRVSFLDKMGHEISMLVNCNQRPEDMLILEGRALPPLSVDEINDVAQLVNVMEDGSYEQTDFFREAVSSMFLEHARRDDKKGQTEVVLDAIAIARWMSKSLGSEEKGTIGTHDKRVLTTLSRHAAYGTGYLTEGDFHRLYMSSVTSCIDGTDRKIGRQLNLKLPTIDNIWRDIRNHGMLSPVEAERARHESKIRETFGAADSVETKQNGRLLQSLLDECEILGWEEDNTFATSTTEAVDGSLPRKRSSLPRKRSSHELIELASDNKTPLRMRDGDFVFIDEESCIGCAQCAQVCPSSFVMTESGRARTFSQRSAPDVPMAVSVCPVNCMHKVSFPELQEMERARDDGDGRDDHQHLGHRRGHTPLSVAGIDSDANHRSSWYHYLKQKCHMSSECPKRGCYDCPHYDAPGENPFFKELQRKAEKVRVNDIIAGGLAEEWRKTAEL